MKSRLMKNLIIVLSVFVLGLNSCQTANFDNFNKQKFTSLKPLEAKQEKNSDIPEQDKVNLAITAQQTTADNADTDELDRLTENDPKILAIQEAIKNEKPIFISDGEKLFQVRKPFYDGISRSLIGDLVEVIAPVKEDYLELRVKEVRESRYGLTEISTNDINSFQSKQVEKEKVEEPEEEIEPLKEEGGKKIIKQEPTQAMDVSSTKEANDFYYKSKSAQKARGTYFLGLALAIVVIGTVLAFLSTFFMPLIIIAAVALVPALALMITSSRASKRYYNEAKKSKVKIARKGRNIKNAASVFMVLGIIASGLGLLIGGIWILMNQIF